MAEVKNTPEKSETKDKTQFKNKIKKRVLPTLLISFALPLIVCICVPFEIFGNNTDEFLFSLSDFFGLSFLFALLFTAVLFFAFLFLPDKAYRITCAVFLAFAFLFFIQGTYLNQGLYSLAGDNLGTATVTIGQKILNLLIWIVVLAGAVVLSILKDKNGLIGTIALIVCGIVIITQLMSPVMLCVTVDGIFSSREERVKADNGVVATKILTNENLTIISENKNIFYFCIDRFDQSYANQAYAECPEVFSALEGFTAFDDNISLYGHTFPGITNLLTAKRYDAAVSRETFLNGVYLENDTLDVLHENGYKVNLFTQPYYAFTDASFLPEYVSNVSEASTYEVENKLLLSFSLMQIALYRCFPLAAKPLIGNLNSATCNSYVTSEGTNGYSQFSTDMKDTWTAINQSEFSTVTENIFSFIHVEGCHGVDYDEDWNKASLSERNDIMISLKNSFKIIGKYLDAMKQAGVYDDATIIITGDHAFAADDGNELESSSLTALFFKPSGKGSGELARSAAQVSHDDVWPTIFDSVGVDTGNTASTLFEIDPAQNREREYYWHTYFMPMAEHVYTINGTGNNFSNWNLVKTNYYNKYIMD